MAVDPIKEGVLLREDDFIGNSCRRCHALGHHGAHCPETRLRGGDGCIAEGCNQGALLEQYYFTPGFDRVFGMSPRLAEKLTDAGVNISIRKVVTLLQDVSNTFSR